ncbi:MAG: cysteine-rich repeat protein [Hyphomicrobiaceae bacterium]|jgi:cysteine-rich repeat protein
MAAAQERALFRDIYGLDPDSAVIFPSDDKDGSFCQVDTIERYGRILRVMTRAFRLCASQGLGNGSIVSSQTLETCFDELTFDPSGLIERARAKMEVRLRKKCFGVDLASAFPGGCFDSVDAAAFTAWVERKALCRTCIMINTADDILGYCDVFDDGVANATCVDPKRCGDGFVDAGEDCDDGNKIDGDCCAADCSAESLGNACDDGLFCTVVDQCADGLCVGVGSPCAAGGECADTCDENGDTCLVPAGVGCSSDSNPCTDDECAGACSHPFNSAPCDDGNACTDGDVCFAGACTAGGPLNCDDSNVCTNDSCDTGGDILTQFDHAVRRSVCCDG